uniref:Uncharacterized protein n=1 Tax=Rhizophora mucronata TaxID=61149 RepID=A0A2P2PHH3_RHIMU
MCHRYIKFFIHSLGIHLRGMMTNV